MLNLYSGTPGSGKSLHIAQLIYKWIRVYKSNVITVNMNINSSYVYTKHGKKIPHTKRGIIYNFKDFTHINPQFFYDYARKFHKKGKEHQTVIIIDEAQTFFNPVVVKEKNQHYKELKSKGIKIPYVEGYREDWLKFFTQHRHLGFDICLVSQFDKLIDAPIRCLFEYNYVHRKINNYSIGFVLTLLGISLFKSTQFWYGAKLRTGNNFFFYQKKYSKIYDSYKLFDEVLKTHDVKVNDKIIAEAAGGSL